MSAFEQLFTSLGFDGRWSLLTELLRIAFKVENGPVFMDRNWVITPQNFCCPLCQQTKAQLAGASKGALLAILHVDHDHFTDEMMRLARQMGVGGDLRPLASKYASYPPLILCNRCNWIDSRLKMVYQEIPPWFSFPPAVKQQLVASIGRKQHKIDLRAGLAYWHASVAQYEEKLHCLKRDLQDLVAAPGPFIGYRPQAAIFHKALERYLSAPRGEFQDVSFGDFIKRSIAWPTIE